MRTKRIRRRFFGILLVWMLVSTQIVSPALTAYAAQDAPQEEFVPAETADGESTEDAPAEEEQPVGESTEDAPAEEEQPVGESTEDAPAEEEQPAGESTEDAPAEEEQPAGESTEDAERPVTEEEIPAGEEETETETADVLMEGIEDGTLAGTVSVSTLAENKSYTLTADTTIDIDVDKTIGSVNGNGYTLTITGDGTHVLTVLSSGNGIDCKDANDLTTAVYIRGGRLKVVAGKYAIRAAKVEISGGVTELHAERGVCHLNKMEMEVSGGDTRIHTSSYGIFAYTGRFTMSGGRLSVNAVDTGIYMSDDTNVWGHAVISGGELLSSGGDGKAVSGIFARNALLISGEAYVSAKGGEYGLRTLAGDISLSESATVVASCKTGRDARAISPGFNYKVNIADGLDIIQPAGGTLDSNGRFIMNDEAYATDVLIAPKTTTLSATPENRTLEFGSLPYGYTEAPTEKEITLQNTGAENATVSISCDSVAFTVSPSDPPPIPANGGECTLRVWPTTGLPAGTHTGILTVTAEGGQSLRFLLRFTVTSNGLTGEVKASAISPNESRRLEGDTTLVLDKDLTLIGLDCAGHTLTVKDTGSLTVNQALTTGEGGEILLEEGTVSAPQIIGGSDEHPGKLRVNGGSLSLRSTYVAVPENGAPDILVEAGHFESGGSVHANTLRITGGTTEIISASGNTGEKHLYVKGAVLIGGTAEVTLQTTASPHALQAGGDVTICDNAKVTIQNETGISSRPNVYGLNAQGKLILQGQVHVKASAATAALRASGFTIADNLEIIGGRLTEQRILNDLEEEAKEIEIAPFPEELKDQLWAAEIRDQSYTGAAVRPSVSVYYGWKLLSAADYTLSYRNNTNAADRSAVNAKGVSVAPTVTIKGRGNYAGTITKTFTIRPLGLGSQESAGRLIISGKSAAVKKNNAAQKPVPVIQWVNAAGKTVTLKNGRDYTIDYGKAQFRHFDGTPEDIDTEKGLTLPGVYHVPVTGMGNFALSGEDVTFEAVLRDSSVIDVSKLSVPKIPDQTYNYKIGTAYVFAESDAVAGSLGDMRTALKDKNGDRFHWRIKNGSRELDYQSNDPANSDYTLSYLANDRIGTATVIIRGNPARGYGGKRIVTFKIKGTSIAKMQVTGLEKSYVYTGSVIKPEVQIAKLYEGNYRVSYLNNINKGKATVIFTGRGAYTGTIKKTFAITAYNITNDTDADGRIRVYFPMSRALDDSTLWKSDGTALPTLTQVKAKAAVKPEPVVTYTNPVTNQTERLVYGRDYTLSWSNNSKVKTAPDGKKDPTVTIKGKGNFTGQIKRTFNIAAGDFSAPADKTKDISKAVVTIVPQVYTGDFIELTAEDITVAMKKNGTPLNFGTDYSIVEGSYEKNVQKGTAKVSICGTGMYGGVKTVSFKIVAKQMNYTIRYDANGGTGTMKDSSTPYGGKLAKCTFKAPAGKVFRGWSLTAGGDVAYADRAPFTPLFPLRFLYGTGYTLYAVWGSP